VLESSGVEWCGGGQSWSLATGQEERLWHCLAGWHRRGRCAPSSQAPGWSLGTGGDPTRDAVIAGGLEGHCNPYSQLYVLGCLN